MGGEGWSLEGGGGVPYEGYPMEGYGMGRNMPLVGGAWPPLCYAVTCRASICRRNACVCDPSRCGASRMSGVTRRHRDSACPVACATLCGQWGECARGYRQPRRGSVHLRHVCVCVSMRRTAVSQRRCGIRLRHGSVPACAAAPCSSGGVTRPGHGSDGSRLCVGVRGVCPTFPIGDADSGWCVRRRPVILLLSHSRIHHPLV